MQVVDQITGVIKDAWKMLKSNSGESIPDDMVTWENFIKNVFGEVEYALPEVDPVTQNNVEDSAKTENRPVEFSELPDNWR